jgi:hypothetical protein
MAYDLQEEQAGLNVDRVMIESLCNDWQSAEATYVDEQLKVRRKTAQL